MFAPIRALSFRPQATPALLVAAGSITLHFAATPFLLSAITEHYGVSLGVASLISVTQVAGFTISNVFAGRRLVPRRRLLVGAAVVGVAANLGSAFAGSFEVLLVLRGLAGVAAGLITWLAWSEAMRDRGALKDVSGVGPLTALVGSPAIAWLLTVGDEKAVFVALAISCAPAGLMQAAFDSSPLPARRRMSPSRSNVVLLIALGLMTAAGSSLFIFAASVGQERIGLAPFVVSLAFSANAGAGLLATRREEASAKPWLWMAVIAACAVVLAFGTSEIGFYAAMAMWGYAFWRAVPVVLEQVAAWSLAPEERTGDAQGIMALGRVAGPAVGGALLGVGSFGAVGIGAVAGLLASSLIVREVGRYRIKYPERRPLSG